ncbi:tRNA (guanosine(37)-N1)-methyltransferase TrmD [Candidatus Shapirobacteria bacterium]|nr:MAG: tRNA (guanosine(37)-N1)-methyltransferase TrmD [Candidatus Shapirobacteria bacterium]
MQIEVVTLFPKMFESVFGESMVKKGVEKGLIKININNLRDWATDSYGSVDDHPFGGGVGMLIRVDVVARAVEEIKKKRGMARARVIALSAKGKKYKQAKAEELAKGENLILVCGHYEGFDQRVLDFVADEVISIGDYILSGGEIGAMVIIDSLSRLIKGVLGKEESSQIESFSKIAGKRNIEYPQYTKPRNWQGHKVPDILLSGNHQEIKKWRKLN